MNKFLLSLAALLFSFSAYSQFPNPGVEGFEGTSGPAATTGPWNLSTGVAGNQWAVFDNGLGNTSWTINTALPYQGLNSAYMNRVNVGDGNTSNHFLATPRVQIPANGQLRFWNRTFTNGNTGTFYDIKVTANNPTAADQTNPAAYVNNLVTYSEDQVTQNMDGVQNAFNIYTEKVINFPASMYGQFVYIAFVRRNLQVGTALQGDRWLLDNVQLNERCQEPTNLATAGIFSTSANLTWANPGGATSWEIEILPAATARTGYGVTYSGPLPYLATTTAYSTTPPTLIQTPLTPATAYKYYVRAICPGNIPSDAWAGPFNFITTLAPPLCGGTFLDPGGTGNYANNINGSLGTTTIFPTPANPGDLVTVSFNTFATQAGLDILNIYDGSVVTPSALLATISGGLPAITTYTSSAANGALTFVFTSNATTPGAGWTASVTCGPPPVCPKPTAVTPVPLSSVPTDTGIYSNSINVGFTNVGPATSWQYILLPAAAAPPLPGAVGLTVPSNPFLISGLSPTTCYKVYIKADCSSTSNGFSLWSNPLNFCTPVVPPACNGQFVDPGGPGANYAANTNSIVPICGTTPGDIVTVTFTAFALENGIDFLTVYDGNGVSGTPILSLTGNAIPASITATNSTGCLTFVFTSDGIGQQAGWIANVTCVTPPPCQQPTALSSAALTSNSVTLNWTAVGVGTGWQVLQQPCTSPPPTAATTGWIAVNTPPTTYNFTGLLSNTCYNLYVRSDCSSTSNGVSLWSGPITVTTQIAPPVCGGNFVDVGGPTGLYPNNSNNIVTICPDAANPTYQVTVTFTEFFTEAQFDGLYVYDGIGAVPSTLLPSTNGPGFVPGGLGGSYWGNLTGNDLPGPFTASSASGCLTFVFISDGIVNNPGWLANVTCAPPPTCPKPTGVAVSGINTTSATVTWTEMGTATQWQVLALPYNAPAPTAGTPGWQTANATTYVYSPLPAGAYKVYVRAVCSPTDISLWSNAAVPPPISTSVTQYTITQLVEDVLLNSSCATVTNITSSTGTNFGSTNGIGYFNQNGSTFPFSDGIILTTGSAMRAPGPNVEQLSDGTWPGDAQLLTYIQGLGIDPFLNSYNNATRLEFDFVPLVGQMSFDFIFASEEYGTFQCDFSDAFAFFLTNTTTGVTTNLAVLPSTTTPISVITIRDQLYNAGCGSANAQYFANYYGDDLTGLDPITAPIDFEGHTVPLTASSNVIPGQQYHIKLVIADRNDSLFDSAVFLKGSSFNIGTVNLGDDLLEATNNALCDTSSYTIATGLNPAAYTFSWTFNGNPIPNEFGPSITVTQPGTYAISAQFNNTTCASTGQVTIEFYAPVASGTPNNMSNCNSSGFAQFNLSLNNPSSLGGLTPADYSVVYYPTMAAATGETGALPTLYTNTTQFLQTIYVRVENIATGCFTIKPFNLVVQDLTPLFTINSNFSICAGTSGTITVTPTNYNNADATYTWTLDGNPFPGTTNQITVTQAGVYMVTVNNFGCLNTGQTTVVVTPIPVPDAPGNVTACGSYTLPSLTVGNYFNSPNGVGPITNLTLTASQLVYVYAESGTNPNCTAQNSFQVDITPLITPTFAAIPAICQGFAAPALPLVSTNVPAITGTWSPASIDTSVVGTVNYTFTPNPGQCAAIGSLSVTINAPSTIPLFNPIANICQGLPAPALPTASINGGIIGTWTPATIDTSVVGTVTYVFTPSAGQCAVATNLTVTIDAPSVVPLFNPISSICQGFVAPLLPSSSTNGITGTWNPATIDTSVVGTVTYNFTPDPAQCAVTTSITVTINAPATVPLFNPIATLCLGDAAPILPSASVNGGITGTWSPSTVDTSVAGTVVYTFTPDPLQCAVSTTISVTIIAPITPTFTQIAPICQGGTAPALPTSSTNTIPVSGTWSPATIATNTPGDFIYTFTSDAGQCSAASVTMTITIQSTPVLAPVSAVNVCDSYTLPPLTVGNYYSSPNGVGLITNLTLTTTQTVHVYAQSSGSANCSDSDSFQVTITPSPQFTVEGGCQGSEYVLEVNPGNFDLSDATYTWSGPGAILNNGTPSIVVTTPGPYTCVVSVGNGCSSPFVFNATDISCQFPLGISPNSDGLNDFFDLSGFNVSKLSIINRYGKTVYSKTDYKKEWGGQSDSGNELPDGTYYFVMERKDGGDTKTGWVYINREIR